MRAAAAAAILVLFITPAAWADPSAYRTEYAVTVLGIPVANTSFDTLLDDDGYRMKGSLKSSGLVSLFSPITGSLDVHGRISGDKVATGRFKAAYKYGDDPAASVTIDYARGTVAKTEHRPKPKPKPRPKGWVDLKPEQLKGTVDPVTAALVPASSPRDVCGRTLRVFDGDMRADLKLTYLRTVPFITQGYKGTAVTCTASFQPVSGYQKGKHEIEWMRDKAAVEISFAEVGESGIYAPVIARISTQYGPVHVRATRLEKMGNDEPLVIDVK